MWFCSRPCQLLLVLASLCASAVPVGATPPASSHLGGTTFVGPTSAHPSSIFYNPAALTQITDRHRFFAIGNQRVDAVSVDRATIDSTTGEPAANGDLTFDPVTAIALSPGGFAGSVHAFGDHRLAFALYTPYSDKKPSADGLGYHTLGSSFTATNLSLSWALRVNGRLSIGVAVSTTLFRNNDLHFLRDRGLEDCPEASCALEEPRFAEEYRIRSNETFAISVLSIHTGFLARVPRIPKLTVGMSYISRSAPIGQGSVTESGEATVTGFEPDGVTAYRLTGPARIKYRLPQSIFAGLRYTLSSRLDLLLNFQWRNFSRHSDVELRLIGASFRAHNVPEQIIRYRGYNDTFTTDAGFEWDATTHLRLAAMFRHENSAVATARVSPSQIEGSKLDLSLGARLRISQHWTATMGYSLARTFTQVVGQSDFSPTAFTDCVNSGFNFDRCQAVREGRAIPTAAGTYKRLAHEFSFGLTYQIF